MGVAGDCGQSLRLRLETYNLSRLCFELAMEDNLKKKLGLARMLVQNPKPAQPSAPGQAELFDLKNFRKGLRNNLTGRQW